MESKFAAKQNEVERLEKQLRVDTDINRYYLYLLATVTRI